MNVNDFNDSQLLSVEHIDGPMLVLAGAGTGKTSVICGRVVNLIKTGNAKPNEIMAVTFTNKAANEIKNRVRHLIDNIDTMYVGTFHSIGAKILRQYHIEAGLSQNFTIIDEDDKLSIIKHIATAMNIQKEYCKPISAIISKLKGKCINHYDNYDIDKISNHINIRSFYNKYQETIASYNMLDFDDLILQVINLMQNDIKVLSALHAKFKYIMVDEYQDTSYSQHKMIGMIAGKNNNIFCVGDEDQSIYSWRGAEIDNVMKFENNFNNARILNLEQNYRSTENILAVANALISKNKLRYGKILKSNVTNKRPVHIVQYANNYIEAEQIINIAIQHKQDGIKYSEIAILVRNSVQIPILEESAMRKQIPYRILDGVRFYNRKEIKDILSYLRLANCHNDLASFRRIINIPKRGIGPKMTSTIEEHAASYNGDVIATLQNCGKDGIMRSSISEECSNFGSLISSIRKRIDSDDNVQDILDYVINASGYMQMLKEQLSNNTDEKAQDRIDNLRTLITMTKFNSINEMLEYISLASVQDGANDEDAINIITIHGAKGLEFDVVFLPGWEEDILPNNRAINDNGCAGLEEERRIGYVAITRAKKHAMITYTNQRFSYGQWHSSTRSRFIDEILQNASSNAVQHNTDNSSDRLISTNKINRTVQLSNASNAHNMKQHENISYNVNDVIWHERFGKGTVLNIMGTFLEIKFQSGPKHIIQKTFIQKYNSQE